MNNLTKIIAAIAALVTAVGGLLVALGVGEGDSKPQPVTTIIIQQPGDYQEFVNDTDLSQYDNLKS